METSNFQETENSRVPEEEEEEEQEEVEEVEEYDEEELTDVEISKLLNLAVENDRVDVLKEILQDYGNKVNGIDITSLPSPLHVSISSSSIQCVHCLLRMGANPSFRPKIEKSWKSKYREYDNMTAYDMAKKKNKSQIDHAFFIEMVRAMSAGELSRVEELLESGYAPDKGILDWIPEDDKNLEEMIVQMLHKYRVLKKEKEITKPESLSLSSSPSTIEENKNEVVEVTNNENEMNSVVTVAKKIEESKSLQKQLASSLEDIIQQIKISKNILLNGNSILVALVKKMKAQIAQKEVESYQYLQLCDSLNMNIQAVDNKIAHCLQEKTHPDYCHNIQSKFPKIAESSDITRATNENVQNNQQDLEQELEKHVSKINETRRTLVDLIEENTRISKEIDQRGLSGALGLLTNLHHEIRALDYQIQTLKEDEQYLLKLLKQNEMHYDDLQNTSRGNNSTTLLPQAEEDSSNDNDHDDCDEEFSNHNSSDIFTGKSKALIIRQSNRPLNIWEIIRRLIGSISMNKDSSRSSSVMII